MSAKNYDEQEQALLEQALTEEEERDALEELALLELGGAGNPNIGCEIPPGNS